MEGNNVVSTVFEECGFKLDFSKIATNPLEMQIGEVVAVAAIAAEHKHAKTRLCQAINASAFLTVGETIEPVLAQMCKHSIMRGIRDSAAACEYPEIFSPGHEWANSFAAGGRNMAGVSYLKAFDHPQFREGFALLEKYHLSFEAWVYHKQIPMVTRLARAYPNTAIVLCHEGSPVFAEGMTNQVADSYETVLAEWKANIDEAATCPNLMIKVCAHSPRQSYLLPLALTHTPPQSNLCRLTHCA
jgi:predicted TIM-barrel fold metal-dependent hydrolase